MIIQIMQKGWQHSFFYDICSIIHRVILFSYRYLLLSYVKKIRETRKNQKLFDISKWRDYRMIVKICTLLPLFLYCAYQAVNRWKDQCPDHVAFVCWHFNSVLSFGLLILSLLWKTIL